MEMDGDEMTRIIWEFIKEMVNQTLAHSKCFLVTLHVCIFVVSVPNYPQAINTLTSCTAHPAQCGC